MRAVLSENMHLLAVWAMVCGHFQLQLRHPLGPWFSTTAVLPTAWAHVCTGAGGKQRGSVQEGVSGFQWQMQCLECVMGLDELNCSQPNPGGACKPVCCIWSVEQRRLRVDVGLESYAEAPAGAMTSGAFDKIESFTVALVFNPRRIATGL